MTVVVNPEVAPGEMVLPILPVIAGLDLSLTATGIATAAGQCIVTSDGGQDDPLVTRRRRLTQLVTSIVAALAPAGLVYVEGPSFGQKQQRGTFDRAGLWWLVVECLVTDFVDVVEVSPSTLKKYATGKGNATKADIRVATLQRYGHDIRDDNMADAFILRAIGLDLAGTPLVKLPASHRSALGALNTGVVL